MSDLYLNEAVESGRDEGHGNLLGIQPFMLPVDYTTPQTLLDKLDGYFAAAQEKSWLTEKTIVVLPEYLGSWLVAAGEPSRVYAATNLQAAMRALALNHPLHFGRTLRVTKAADRTAAALFRMKALEMAQGYQFVFIGAGEAIWGYGGCWLHSASRTCRGCRNIGARQRGTAECQRCFCSRWLYFS
jgi:hypothetical protein